MRITIGVAKFSGLVVVVGVGLLLLAGQAAAQSTDWCQNINGESYKFCCKGDGNGI